MQIEIDEEWTRLRARAERGAPRGIARGAGDRLPREGQEGRFLLDARGVGAQRQRGVDGELLRAGDRHLAVEEPDAPPEVDLDGLASLLLRSSAEEDPLAPARHRPRVEVVVLHEALGGCRAQILVLTTPTASASGDALRLRRCFAVAHRERERLLLVERQPIAPPVGVRVEAVSDAPEELLGGGHLARLARDEQAEANQLPPDAERHRGRGDRARAGRSGCAERRGHAGRDRFAHAKTRPRSPARAVEITQPARAALHLRLEQVHAPSEARVSRRGLVLEPLDERPQRAPVEEPRVRAIEERSRERLVARDGPQIEERRRGREIVLREREHFVWIDHLVTDGEPGVPERIEERLDELGRNLAALRAGRDDDPDVGVAPEGDRPAAIAPDRREAEIRRPADCRARGGEERAHEPVEHLPVPHPEALSVFSQRHGPLHPGRDRRARRIQRRGERLSMALKVRAELSSERRCGANQRVRGDRHAAES